jgi:hypothetical protein
MSNTNDNNPLAPPTHAQIERIRERAYFLWEQDGCPDGQADEYWERARELQAVADSVGSGQLSPDAPRDGDLPEEAELQDNLGEFPDRLSDQGEHRGTPMTRVAEHAALQGE